MSEKTYTMNITCDDRPGIVATVTTELAAIGANIAESSQYWDRKSNSFFMRLAFTAPEELEKDKIENLLKPAVDRFNIQLDLRDTSVRSKIIVMVSKFDHALLHLIYQIRVGWIQADVVAIVSNHEDSANTAQLEGIPYYYWPINKDNKKEREEQLWKLIHESDVDLVVLARYMQVLSDDLSGRLLGKVINIHHSFLPSFKGAKPYHQAFDRGVKLIGATSHYVTPDLDEGPIIEQETERVTHAMTAEDYVATGRDIESRVLARAVKLHLERRVMLNGGRTVVFA